MPATSCSVLPTDPSTRQTQETRAAANGSVKPRHGVVSMFASLNNNAIETVFMVEGYEEMRTHDMSKRIQDAPV